MRVDNVIQQVSLLTSGSPQTLICTIRDQVRDYHRKYLEHGTVSRDVVIVAHGHFNRVAIARWNKFPLYMGMLFPQGRSRWLTRCRYPFQCGACWCTLCNSTTRGDRC